ncbi:MAG: hypothetical protein AAGC88_08275 [Bacteroidota bacterium]
MKRIIQYSVFSIMALFLGCNDDDYEPPSATPSNVHITTGFGTGTPIVQVNGFESFADLSIGVESREWTFPGGDVTDITTSSEDVLQVTFNKIGTYEVSVSLDFLEPPFDWRTQTVRSSDQVDSTLIVTVVDSIRAQFQAFYIAIDGSDSTELDMSSGALNQLMAGESIRIKQNSIGAPSVLEYTSEGGSPEFIQVLDDPEAVVEIKYKRLGQYDLTFNPFRTKPQGSDLITLENFIEVIPSTRPVVLEDVYRFDETTVAMSFSRSIADPGAEVDNFVVRAINVVRNNLGIPVPFDENLPIVSAATAAGDDDNILLLNLGDNIYNSDTVFVSYLGGNLQTTDGITSNPIDEFPLDFRLVNLAEEYGSFENDGEGWMQNEEVRTEAGFGQFEWARDRVFSGEQSLRLSSVRDANDVPQWIEVITDVDLDDPAAADAYNAIAVQEGDKFYITYQTYVESVDPISADTWEALDMYLWLQLDKLVIHEYRLGVEPRFPTGEWVKIEALWGGLAGAGSEAVLRPYFRTIGNITVVVDDLQIYAWETRPAP